MNVWREIIESLPDAIIVIAQTRAPIAVNPAADALIGASRVAEAQIDQLLKQNSWLAAMVDSCLTSGQSLDNPEAVLHLDRRQVSVRAMVSPMLDRRARAHAAIVQLTDLSHQRNVERAAGPDPRFLRLSAAGLAHEVKNPLTGIKGAAELMSTIFPDDRRARQYCEVILHGVGRITSMVEQVLAASTPNSLKQEALNIHQVLHQALRLAGLFEPPPEGIVIEQIFDPSLPPVIGDADALERVFLNLLRNAVDAIRLSAAGSGVIRIRTAMEQQFRQSTKGRRRRFLRVAISDSGIGMTPLEIEQLFAPFFTTKAGGHGLGLVLSQHLVALHGGKLWAEAGGDRASDERKEQAPTDQRTNGMTFCAVLPLHDD